MRSSFPKPLGEWLLEEISSSTPPSCLGKQPLGFSGWTREEAEKMQVWSTQEVIESDGGIWQLAA